MAKQFQGFKKSAPKELPVTQQVSEETSEGTTTATSAWGGDDVYNLHKFSITFREGLDEILQRVLVQEGEIAKNQKEIVDQQKKMVDKLAQCERKDTTLFATLIGIMVVFLTLFAFK